MEKVSYENSQRIISRRNQIESDLEYYINKGFRETKEQLRSELNKALYEMAEESKISLYDLCFNVVPRMKAIQPTIENLEDLKASQFKCEYALELEPLELQLDKGPDYWEVKYRKLKADIEKLLKNADKAGE